MIRANQLDRDRACVLVIDLQEKLLPLIRGHEQIISAATELLEGLRVFNLPILATEQYPKGLGHTHPSILACIQSTPQSAIHQATILEKATFSACGHHPVREALQTIDRPQVILTGIETHVCVQQTALDLRTMDYDVFLCADACGSRGRRDEETALDRLRHEGVIVTTVESVLFELCNRCDTSSFKAMIEVIKAHPPKDKD
ncbi:MAG: hydrolase [Planctomycetota bacterium]